MWLCSVLQPSTSTTVLSACTTVCIGPRQRMWRAFELRHHSDERSLRRGSVSQHREVLEIPIWVSRYARVIVLVFRNTMCHKNMVWILESLFLETLCATRFSDSWELVFRNNMCHKIFRNIMCHKNMVWILESKHYAPQEYGMYSSEETLCATKTWYGFLRGFNRAHRKTYNERGGGYTLLLETLQWFLELIRSVDIICPTDEYHKLYPLHTEMSEGSREETAHFIRICQMVAKKPHTCLRSFLEL